MLRSIIVDARHRLAVQRRAPAADDEARVVPVRQEQLKERLWGGFRALDAPLLVAWADGRREAVAFVLEEESNWRRFSLRRLARYGLDVADRVVPVAIFLRDAARASTRDLESWAENVLDAGTLDEVFDAKP